MNKKRRLLKKLQDRIPSFTCIPGCHDCCGPVPFSKIEWNAVKDKRMAKGINCPYQCEEGCAIYKDRPLICRLFGASEDQRLKCPHGCGPKKPLTKEETAKIMVEYLSGIMK